MMDKGEFKNINITDLEVFKNMKKFLCDRGDQFQCKSVGATEKIIYKDKVFTYVDLKENSGRGFHLSRIFKRDVDIWLSDPKNKASVRKWNVTYKEQMFNLGAIEKSIGYPSVAIDINDCYWKTAYKLGYITEQTYIIGKRKKEWKTGRNACIGSLIKTESIVPYSNGKPNYKLRQVKRPLLEYQCIRNHIIGYVHDMFFRLYEELGSKFYMFLTDCIFTSYDSQKYIENYFALDGYKVKSKPIDFVLLDRKEKRVWWHDFEAEDKDNAGNLIKTGKDTYYIYASHQILDHSTLC